jgi:predicted amino acid-binding ACT domain protein
MKTFIYLVLAIVGLTGTISGTIKLSSTGLTSVNVEQTFITTFLCMGLFVLFGYAFYKHIKEFK